MASARSNGLTHSPITPDNHSPIIEIAVYFLMVTFILAVIIRFAIRLAIARTLGKDDWLSLGSMIAGIAQCIAVAVGVHYGLGKQEHILSHSQITGANKSQYAADWFYMAGLSLAKVSVLLLLHRLSVSKLHKKIAVATIGMVSLWSLAGIVTLAARCGGHLPWNINSTDKCINLRTFWIAMSPVDVLTELVMIVLPVLMMIPVQVALSKKVVIVVAFLFRVLVIATTITRLFYIIPVYPARNFTFNTVNAEILNQLVLSVSITTACIPCLKPFLDAFDSGQMAVVIEKGRVGGSHSGSRSYPMRDLGYANNIGYNNNKAMVTSEAHHDEDDMDMIDAIKYTNSHSNTNNRSRKPSSNTNLPSNGTAYPINEKDNNTDGGSVASSSKSDQMIIKKNVQYSVKYEDAPHDELVAPASGSHSGSRRQSQQNLHDQFVFDDTAPQHSRRHATKGSGPGMAM